MSNKAKTFLFAYYWVVPVVVFLALLIALGLEWLDKENQPLWLTLITGALGWTYFFQKQKLEEDKLFLDSFEKFNKRFHELSGKLHDVLNSKDPVDTQRVEVLPPVVHQYFDLCLEEYQLYKKGRIPEETWRYWAQGMCYFLEHAPVRRYWEQMERECLDDGLKISYLESFLGKTCNCRNGDCKLNCVTAI
ncbi:MAG: hypothetical protein PHE17_15495 [Thiothrix sp.]|uniref:hypothetical protein n=1 Tax=Thiothrix sp. TaxID=1032 RepID=UPI0026354168|nr:hypothetical protein [Thiothrix sp.]MDD5394419.1 hypothetical protein [Thiothrix sp.]